MKRFLHWFLLLAALLAFGAGCDRPADPARDKLAALHARRERYVRVYTEALFHTHHEQESLDEHGAIVAAISRGDAEAAERHAVFNHRNALERYRRIAASRGDREGWN